MNKLRFCIFMASLLFSLTTWGQGITMEFHDESLPTVFKRLEKVTDYKFVFAYDDVKAYKVSGRVEDSSIGEALSFLLSGKPLTYSINGRIVNIKKGIKKTGERNVSGIVLEQESGEPVVGATVRVEGTKIATATDANGQFSLTGVPVGSKIQVSYIGMTSQSLPASSYMNIKLKAALRALNDVVVIGYGSTQRKDLTGSVSVVDPDELVNAPAVTLDDALAGKAAGVQITKADGSPGGSVRIRVRGGSSLTGAVDPLYVIDGIPTEVTNNYLSTTDLVNPIEAGNYGENEFGNSVSGSFARGLNSIAGLNIEDIETITVMKDASATAIYGSKAANGVVIITTKRGRHDQKPTFNFKYSLGITTPIKEDMLDGEGYIKGLKEAINNSIANITSNYENGYLSKSSFDDYVASDQKLLAEIDQWGNANTDWLDKVLRTGVTNNIDFSVSGGSEKSRYYSSFSYTNQSGTLISTDFRRLTGNVSLDNDITSRFHTFIKMIVSYGKNNITNGVYGQAVSAPPILPAYNDDGTFADYSEIGGVGSSYMGYQNPLAVATSTNQAKTYRFMGSFSAEYEILKDLKFKTTVSVDWTNYHQLNYIPSYLLVSSYYGAEDSGGGAGSESESTTSNIFWENNLTWNHKFGEAHAFNVVLGHSWEKDKSSFFSASGKGYPDDTYLNNLSSAITPASVEGSNPSAQSSLLSFYGRINYTLLDRYLFTVTGRSDTSSKFSKSHRTGFFPSCAFAWRISQEKFLRDVKWIDDIKLRASIGKTGTQHISDWMYLTLYSPGTYAGKSAIYPSQMGNDDIKWESTVQKDLGIDFSLFNGRLSGTLAYYDKTTDDALLSVTPAPSSGFSNVITNIAKINNNGWEVELNGTFIRTHDWNWTGSLNISHNSSKVKKIQANQFTSATDRNALNLGTSLIREGESLGLLCGRKADGIIQTQEELEDYMNKFSLWKYFMPDLGVGSVKLALDENGSYYEDVIGNCTPDFYGGFTNIINYKGWSLLATFTFSEGNDLIYQKDVTDMTFSSTANRSTRLWNGHKGLTNLYNSLQFLTNLNVYDASYLKLQTLSLAYNFRKNLLKKLHLNSAQVYVTASNLFTITSYPGPDPAVSDDPYSISGGGRDASTYPTVRSYNFGVRIGF